MWAVETLNATVDGEVEQLPVDLRARLGIARAIYVTAVRRRVVIVRVFVKKTQKTPKHELELARQRATDIK